MKAFTLENFETAAALRDDVPEPTPAETEMVVRVHASSINPVDIRLAAGALKDMIPHELPVTIGRDFAGVVERTGLDVTRFKAGDEVFGFLPMANPTVHAGSWAELINVPGDTFAAAKPETIDLAAAGVAPLAGITALAAADALQVGDGDVVLVIGATGGVGSFFTQLAAAAGATVIAPALPEDHDYLIALGATELIERKTDLATAVRQARPDGVDAILDLATYAPDATLLKEGGRLASPLGAAGEGEGRHNLVARPTPENLKRLAELIDSGTLRIQIQHSYALSQASDAMNSQQTTHTHGKHLLTIA